MIVLPVWVTLPDGRTLAVGTLACSEPDEAGRFESEFAYDEGWLRDPDRFPLDPLSLPLGAGRFRARQFEPPLAIFDDALPDDWGRELIVRARRLPHRQQGAPYLLKVMAEHGLGLGALSFSESSRSNRMPLSGARTSLGRLAVAAERFEAGLGVDADALQALFAAGSSPGGARPKVLVRDRGGEWIAKLPSSRRDGRFDVVGLETTGLDLAARAGLPVPGHRLATLGTARRRALLVRRFDVTPAGGRRHMISLRTLCKERPGIYALSYTELAEAVRRASAQPREDVARMFRWMAFNAAFGNTDDHLKNFWMVHDDAGYRLSEAFDLLPDVGERREHCLAFEYGRAAPTRAELLAIAARWDVRDAASILDAVVAGVATFPAVAKSRRVPKTNIDEIGSDIGRRVRLLAGAGPRGA
ncbi:MAG: type II toxin-antitoxin system HipA family toxin [Burkholderiales bacterium]|nr:type II toxin-antitoxin system HipA family toxin [Burkholderiales bacterium]